MQLNVQVAERKARIHTNKYNAYCKDENEGRYCSAAHQ